LYGAVDVAEVSTGRPRGRLNEAVSRGIFVDPGHLLMSDETRESLVIWGWAGEPVKVWMPLGRLDQIGTVRLLDPGSALVGVTRADGRAEIVRAPLTPHSLQRLACGVAGRDLTATEKARYLQREGRTSACG